LAGAAFFSAGLAFFATAISTPHSHSQKLKKHNIHNCNTSVTPWLRHEPKHFNQTHIHYMSSQAIWFNRKASQGQAD